MVISAFIFRSFSMINTYLVIMFLPILFGIFKYLVKYVCYLYSDAILISLLNIYASGNETVFEIPFSDIRAIHERGQRRRNINTTYLTTYSLWLFKYRLIYILCEYKGMKHYYKIRVNDEIYQELNKHFTSNA